MRYLLSTLTLTGCVLATTLAQASEEGGLPQLRQVDTFVSQVLWLFITFGVLYGLMSRIVLPRIADVMEERQDKVDDDLTRAERLKVEAEGVMSEYEKALAEARGKASSVLKQASEEITGELSAREASFAADLAEKSKAAEGRIVQAKSDALANLRAVAAESAVAVTSKLIGVTPRGEAVDRAVGKAIEEQR
jgi:F-type H+-transporting ATPase subunit b